MRPNDLYSWYCVAHSVTNILGHAASIRVNQAAAWSQASISRKRRRVDEGGDPFQSQPSKEGGPLPKWSEIEREVNITSGNLRTADLQASHNSQGPATPPPSAVASVCQVSNAHSEKNHRIQLNDAPPPTLGRVEQPPEAPSRISHGKIFAHIASTAAPLTEAPILPNPAASPSESVMAEKTGEGSGPTPDLVEPAGTDSVQALISSSPELRASKVPSSRLGRLFHYGGLAASLGYGAASEVLRRSSSQKDPTHSSSLLMTEANLNRLVSKLSQMRGAALKLGQFMSIQDSHVLPEELERVFRRVQDSAHYMPNWQMERVMSSSLGPSWRSHFSSFTPIPSHSASIGQVHTGVLVSSSSPTGKEEEVAIKIQFPDIAKSISSDLGYMKILLGASALLPKGLFLDSTIKAFKQELADECDYRREANYIRRFREVDSIKSDSRYRVPWVWEGSTEKVLVMERMKGVSVGGEIVKMLTQNDRNEIAARIIELCLRELFEFRMMQTDPNWTNFLWNEQTRQIELIDFGATREYSSEFIDNWLGFLTAAIHDDHEACIRWSQKLGYFVGGENEAMVNAHLTSAQLLGTPFRKSTPQPFSFTRGSAWTHITEEIRGQIPTMLNNRLTPPPRETYSLNRKLSGAFLLAGRLGASVDCRSLWEKVVG